MNATTERATINKAALFSVYNKARACGLDRARVNRALSIVQAGKVTILESGAALVTGDKGNVYTVRGESCTCPDHQRRGERCKHIVARWLMIRMSQYAAGC